MKCESDSLNKFPAAAPERAVSYRRYGKQYFRRPPSSYKDAKTESQLLQRGRMNAVVAFYRALPSTLFKRIWQLAALKCGCSGYNHFVANNINAFDKEGRIFDYSKITLSAGTLPLSDHITAVACPDHTVFITWNEVCGQAYMRQSDCLMVAAIYDYAPFEVFLYDTGKIIRRDHQAVIPLQRKPGDAVHLYLFFRSDQSDLFSAQRYFCLHKINL